MKEKFSILTLVFLFFISTTGLPEFSHYCKVIGGSSASDCTGCMSEDQMASCCIHESSESDKKIESGKTDCCVDEFNYKKIEDQFSNIQEKYFCFTAVKFKPISEIVPDTCETENSHPQKYTLLPIKSGKQLLESIHQLKLDTPIS